MAYTSIPYPAEFRQQMIELVRAGRTPEELSREFEPSAQTIHRLRERTRAHGALLILDEVITGFRVAPGGAQTAFGIEPDLTTLAKIVAGGLPGGAVAGRKAILDQLYFAETEAAGGSKILHPGTFNANPVSAAAGITALRIIETGDACDRASRAADELRHRFNEILARQRLNWAVYGTYSAFHLFMNPRGQRIDPFAFDPHAVPWTDLKTKPAETVNALRLALLLEGVDISGWPGGLTSAAHTQANIDATVHAFANALERLAAEERLPATQV